MPNTAGSGGWERGAAGPDPGLAPAPHALLVADGPADCRAQTARWVDEQLGAGAKVFYKGGSGAGSAEHWLVGEGGAPRAPDAVASGQLELCDVATVLGRTAGGTIAGARRLIGDEVARALRDEGWPAVAMTQESAGRPMVDDAEAREYAAQEAGFDALAARLPLRTLCQLSVGTERREAVWQAASVHHRHICDRHWRAAWDGRRWWVCGELDAHAVPRFGAALHGALRSRRHTSGGPDLDVDLSAVGFLDFACAQSLTLAARAAGRDQRLVLHGTGAFTRRIIEVAGRPDTLHFADES